MKPKLCSKHRLPIREYIVAVTHGSKTRYFYGRHLKDALKAAGKLLPDGYPFTYARMERQSVTVAELMRKGTVVKSYS